MTTNSAPPWGVYGHDWAVQHLRESIRHGRVRHAYLLVGVESIGKARLAQMFASALLCTDSDPAVRPCGVCSACRRVVSGNHADVLTAREDDDAPAKIETLRLLMSQLALKAYERGYRFGMVPRFDEVRPLVQDALLKTLEEPAPHAILVLTAASIEPILPTILSRSQVLHLRPASIAAVRAAMHSALALDPPETPVSADHIDQIASVSGGRVGWALAALRDPAVLTARAEAIDLLLDAMSRTRAGRFALADALSKEKGLEPREIRDKVAGRLALWQSFWRDALLVSHGAEEGVANRDRLPVLEQIGAATPPDALVAAMHATNTMIRRLSSNANLRLGLEVMLLAYPGL